MKKTYIKPDSIIKEPRLLSLLSIIPGSNPTTTGGGEGTGDSGECTKERTIWDTEEPTNESIWNF